MPRKHITGREHASLGARTWVRHRKRARCPGGEALVAALGVAWRSAWRGSLAQFFLPIEGIATATGPFPLGLRRHAQAAQARGYMQRGAASAPASSLLRLSRARRSGLSAAYFRAPGASDIDCRRRLWLCPHFVPAVISIDDQPSVGVPPTSLRRADPATVSHAGIADRARRALRPAVQAAARRPAAAGKPATAAAAAARRTTAAERAAALHMVEMLGGTHAGFHWHRESRPYQPRELTSPTGATRCWRARPSRCCAFRSARHREVFSSGSEGSFWVAVELFPKKS
mmetsp:Transcript_37795/g.93546  ORF Transcript_37795/g.93546 Transcript_37795/m.93546 type:complete len:286 (+) Transcript_37795:171-1028(+)